MSVMTCDDRSAVDAVRPDRVDQDVEELAARQRVEAGQRLVEEEDRRPRPERERQPDLRLLAAGQLVGRRGERDVQVVEAAPGERRVEAVAKGVRHRDVLVDGQLAVERRGLRARSRSAGSRRRGPATGRCRRRSGGPRSAARSRSRP